MKPIFPQEIADKILNAFLDETRDWQWFIDYLEQNVNYDGNIKTWQEYEEKQGLYFPIFNAFYNIQKIQKSYFIIEKDWVKHFEEIANYCHGNNAVICPWDPFLSLFSIGVIAARDLNSDNKTTNLLTFHPLLTENIFEFTTLTALKRDEEKIISFINATNISEASQLIQTLYDNLNGVRKEPNWSFLKQNEERFQLLNAFQMVLLSDLSPHSWEEEYLLDILKIDYSNGTVIPTLKLSNGTTIPDLKEWTPEKISMMKRDFSSNASALCLVETIDYITNKKSPSVSTIHQYFSCFLVILKSQDQNFYFRHQAVISLLGEWNKNHFFHEKCDDVQMRQIVQLQECLADEKELMFLEVHNVIFSQKMRGKIQSIHQRHFKKLDNCQDTDLFLEYLGNQENSATISKAYFRKAHQLFRKSISKKDNKLSSIFLQYLIFLIRCKTNKKLTDALTDRYLIETRNLWKHFYYFQSLKTMTVFNGKSERIPRKELEEENLLLLENPKILANKCLFYEKGKLLAELQQVGGSFMNLFGSVIQNDKDFPYQRKRRFSTDSCLHSYVLDIKVCLNQNAERIMNSSHDEGSLFENGILDSFEFSACFYAALFKKEKELYAKVIAFWGKKKFLPFPKRGELKIAHIAQFFPFIENAIRKLGERYNIVPVQEDEAKYRIAKEPSTVLNEITTYIFYWTKTAKNAADFIFIDLVLYNSDGLNIRNECIHGRKFQEKSELGNALKLVLFSAALIQQRLGKPHENKKSS